MDIFDNFKQTITDAPSNVKCPLCGSKMIIKAGVMYSSLGGKIEKYNSALVCTNCKVIFPREM